MEPLKEMFNKKYYEYLTEVLKKVYPSFKNKDFLHEVLSDLQQRSLNERMRNTSLILKKCLPQDFEAAIHILKKAIPHTPSGYTNLVFPDFVGLYGHDHFDLAMDALQYFTTFGSSEFAIREFLKRDFTKTITVMYNWAGDSDQHVRRLSSEGSRPRLPWSFKLDAVLQEPETTRPILEQLRADPELYVRKSVANHLNDLSKEHSAYMLRVVNSWNRKHPHTAWIIKHASRTLIKKGHPGALALFNFKNTVKLGLPKLKIRSKKIHLGEYLEFDCALISESAKEQSLVIDFIIHYVKKGGGLAPKVFKLKEVHMPAKGHLKITKRHLFKDFTTRKHYPGKHLLALQINGKVVGTESFYLNL